MKVPSGHHAADLCSMSLRECRSVDDRAFTHLIDIYIRSFPVSEMMPIPVLKARLDNVTFRLWGAWKNESPIAMALCYFFKDQRFVLLDYLAVSNRWRNHGVGTWLVSELCVVLGIVAGRRWLVLEMEDPRFGENVLERAKRCLFYHKMGMRMIRNVRYLMPPFHGSEPIEMILAVSTPMPADILTAQCLATLIRELYYRKYQRQPPDPLLERIIESIPREIELSG